MYSRMRKKNLFSILFPIIIISITLLLSIPSISAYTSRTESSETICINNICNQKIYAGVEFIEEDGEWKRWTEAKSLKDKGYKVNFLEVDEDYPLEVVDFNATSITVDLKKWTILNKNIPLRIWEKNSSSKVSDFKDTYKKVKEDNEKFNLLDLGSKRKTYNFNIGDVLEFGPNSTTLSLSGGNITDDTYVYDQAPDTNYGTGNDLLLAEAGGVEEMEIYIGFNISLIPTGASIEKGEVALYMTQNTLDAGRSFDGTASRITGLWNETGTTWNNKPTFTGSYGVVSFDSSSPTSTWYTWDVNQSIKDMMAISNESVNITIQGGNAVSTGVTDYVNFDSSEDTYYPILNITYSILNISLESPDDNAEFLNGTNIQFNISLVAGAYDLANLTLYIDGISNETLTMAGSTNLSTFIKNSISVGSHNWSAIACDIGGNCLSSLTRDLTITNYEVNSESYPTETIEGSTESFVINISITESPPETANLIYNNTINPATFSISGSDYYITEILTIPSVGVDSNVSFFWNILLNNGEEINTTSRNVTVRDLKIDNCTTNSILLMNLTLFDEETLAQLTSGDNFSIEVDLDIFSLGSSTPLIEFSNSTIATNPYQICLNSTLNDTEYRLDSIISYQSDDRVKEYYHIQNNTLKNSTLSQNINLYDLLTTDSQEFLITFKDESFSTVNDAIIQINRFYVDEGISRTVEIPKTDDNGQTLGHFDDDNVIYNLIVSKNGTVLGIFDNILAVCTDATTGDCTINLNAFQSGTPLIDVSEIGDITYTMLFNSTERTIKVSFTSTDGGTKLILLNTTLFDQFGNENVCSDSLTSSSGSLTCNIPTSFGNVTVISDLFSNGRLVTSRIYTISVDMKEVFGGNYIVMVLIMVMTIPLMFITSTGGVVIGLILGLAMAMLLLMGGSSFIGITSSIMWLVISSGIILWRVTKE